MKKKNYFNRLGIGLLVLLSFLLIAFLQPVDSSKENCLLVTGVVAQLLEAGTKDVVFKLKDNPHRYYINRGLERGLTLPELEQQLLGKKIELWYAQSWQTSGGHIAQVKIGSKVLYSEWRE